MVLDSMCGYCEGVRICGDPADQFFASVSVACWYFFGFFGVFLSLI